MHSDIENIQAALESGGYIADRDIATAIHLAQKLERPLLVEGPAGVGKTEIAKVMAAINETQLIRLQCYEGLDASTAIYEWNYQKQLLHIRMQEGSEKTLDAREEEIFSENFLLERPLLKAIRTDKAAVLLIDEVDRADEAFEAFLLELLSDWQVSIPELGTLKAKHPPYTVLTSNRTRELSDALRRRCLYLWVDYPAFDKELHIIRTKVPGVSEEISAQIVAIVQLLRRFSLEKVPGVAESLDWSTALAMLNRERLEPESLESTISVLLKHYEDQKRFKSKWLPALVKALESFRPGAEAEWMEQAWRQIAG
ncbi:MAG: MoxR family ATPase [Trueperaceae bacterium]|nr:MoxR family ATPase [Trueperaceae bacterium]